MKETVAVALSGGLDSSVAAALLKRKNYRVIGLHFRTGYERASCEATRSGPLSRVNFCAQRISDQIGIPLEVIDCILCHAGDGDAFVRRTFYIYPSLSGFQISC